MKDISEFIDGEIIYDGEGYFWVKNDKDELQMLAEMRGWGAIQNMFKEKDGSINVESAAIYQDKIAKFIVEALNEKIVRESEKT